MGDDLDIRRPELLGQRRSGTVRWYKDENGAIVKCCGFGNEE
jgi:hypothetical protein